MANQEQLTLLKTSITEWNKWRKAQIHILPDLSKADLRGQGLNEADAERVDEECPDDALSWWLERQLSVSYLIAGPQMLAALEHVESQPTLATLRARRISASRHDDVGGTSMKEKR